MGTNPTKTQKPQFTYFHPYWMCFYSKALYRDVAEKWQGFGLHYLFLLLAFTWLLVGFSYLRVASDVIDNISATESAESSEQAHNDISIATILAETIKQLPTITIKNGIASIDKESPYYIRDISGNIILLIDTRLTPDLTDADKSLFVLTRSQFLGPVSYQLATIDFLVIDSIFVQQWLQEMKDKKWMLLIGTICFSFLIYALQAYIYGGIVYLLTQNTKKPFSYKCSVRLACIALTPMILFQTLFRLFPVLNVFLMAKTFFFILTFCYLYFGLKVNLKR